MKSLERRFRNILEKNPCRSSYICFAEAVRGRKFSRQTIHRWFRKLVDKSDYDKKERKTLLANLSELSNAVEDDRKQRQIDAKGR